MDEKKRRQKKCADVYYQFYDLQSVASDGGLTGLIPTEPQSGSELSSYAELESTPADIDDGD